MSGQTIGVIGAGLMGHGIAYLLTSSGPHRPHLRSVGGMAQNAARAAGKLARVARRRSGAARRFGARPDGAGDDRHLVRVRGRAGKAAAQAAAVRRTGKSHRARHDPRQQQLGDPLDPDRREARSTAIAWSARISESAASRAAGREVTRTNSPATRLCKGRWRCCATQGANQSMSKKRSGVGNRLQHALKREAIALVSSGVCDADTIDEVVKSGFGAGWRCSGRWSRPIWSASI